MSEAQKIIATLLEKAFDDWKKGIEQPLFEVDEETRKNCANMIWTMGLNAMAYGLDRGIELGYKMARSGMDGGEAGDGGAA